MSTICIWKLDSFLFNYHDSVNKNNTKNQKQSLEGLGNQDADTWIVISIFPFWIYHNVLFSQLYFFGCELLMNSRCLRVLYGSPVSQTISHRPHFVLYPPSWLSANCQSRIQWPLRRFLFFLYLTWLSVFIDNPTGLPVLSFEL